MTVRYLTCGDRAYLLTRTLLPVPREEALTFTVDLGEEYTLCLTDGAGETLLFPLDEKGTALVPANRLAPGPWRVLFVRREGETLDGGKLAVSLQDGGSVVAVLPALGATALELEAFAAMLAQILQRLKLAEDSLDELKNGPDVL